MTFDLVVAALNQSGGIGLEGDLPWAKDGIRLSGDFAFLKHITCNGYRLSWNEESKLDKFILNETISSPSENAVIMGRKTFESLPKALPGRLNVILTRSKATHTPLVKQINDFDDIFQLPCFDSAQCFILGGSEIYKIAMENNSCKHLFLTLIMDCDNDNISLKCDTFFPYFSELIKFVNNESVFNISKDVYEQFPINIKEKCDYLTEFDCVQEKGFKYKFLMFDLETLKKGIS